MKICTKCKKEKSPNEFNFRVKNIGLRQYQCRECTRAFVRSHYQRNKEYYLIKAKRRNTGQRLEARSYIKEYLQKHSCIDCGESDIIVLEFDHKDNKFKEVAGLVGHYPLLKIKEEIKKCDVRCANCHRKKTAKKFGWSKSIEKMSP
ncbi:MAG: hypothetical protein HYX22_01230 [Candidatus Yanofskybacteria bacterium]|nr:hypothetical protein [Candidatus Yanofskybacteria bacterium]